MGLFGVDMPGILAGAMGPLLLPATLHRVTPGTRGADLGAGTNPTTASHPCRGFQDSYREGQVDGTLVQQGDRRVTLLGGTLPAGVVPQTGDRVTIEGRTYSVIAVDRDPAAATYTLQARG